MKEFIKKRYLISTAIWFLCYMALFGYLEIRPPREVHLISCSLDSYIPCIPAFIYPYLSWFPYILVCACLAVKNLEEEQYKKAITILITGMNVFLLISYIWPTGLNLRESVIYDTSRLSGLLLQFVQTVDVPRNVFPSMHVYVTLVLQDTLEMQRNRLPVWGIWLGRGFAFAIILSTMFTRQHSAVDVLGAAVLFGVLKAGSLVFWDACKKEV